MSGRAFLPGPPTAELEQLFSKRGWLKLAPQQLRSRILVRCRALRFSEGEQIFGFDDQPGGMYGVFDGSVGVEVASATANPVLAHVVRPGWWMGQGPALTGQTRVAAFRAMEPSVLLHLPLVAIADIIADDPDMQRMIGVQSELSGRLSIRIVAELLMPSSVRRIAATLLRVTASDELADADFPRQFYLTQQQIGEMSGYSRHLVNRILRRMEADGAIELHYNRITVVDRRLLIDLAREERDQEAA